MLRTAFKEWAAVCRAIADGRQSVLLRKGGIAEVGGEFRPEHSRFWLYPTHFHEQQRSGLKPAALPLIDAVEADRPPAGTIRLSHYVDVTDVRFADSLDAALALDDQHVWSADTVRQRFHYRTPGLYVLTIRAFAVEPVLVPERPEYAGCKTWVELVDAVNDAGVPVLRT
jgi:hypothetical protein